MHLAPRTALYQSDSGFVLRTADDEHFALSLSDDEIDELVEALECGTVPRSSRTEAALTALVEAGHVVRDAPPVAVSVSGTGVLASALIGMIERTGSFVISRAKDARQIAVSDDGVETVEPGSSATCFRDGSSAIIVPGDVRLVDVQARRAASSRHRRKIEDGYSPTPEGRTLTSHIHPLSGMAAEIVAAHILTEIIDPTHIPHHITAVDLRTFRVSTHPVLPVPEPPR